MTKCDSLSSLSLGGRKTLPELVSPIAENTENIQQNRLEAAAERDGQG